jgi:hypothetical protein
MTKMCHFLWTKLLILDCISAFFPSFASTLLLFSAVIFELFHFHHTHVQE